MATVQAVLRYYQARQRAEPLADADGPARRDHAGVTSAVDLRRVCSGGRGRGARLFGATGGGAGRDARRPLDSLAAVGYPARWPGRWSAGRRTSPVGSRVRTDDAGRLGRRRLAGRRLGDRGHRPAASRPATALRRRAEPLADARDARCCASSPRRSRRGGRGAARPTTRSTASRSRCSAACCPVSCPTCPASTWPCATSRPARRPRSAATSTS